MLQFRFLLIAALVCMLMPTPSVAQNFDANTQITIDSVSPTSRILKIEKDDEDGPIEPRTIRRKIKTLPQPQQTIELKKLQAQRIQAPFSTILKRDDKDDLEEEVVVPNPKAGQKKSTPPAPTLELVAGAGYTYDSNIGKTRVNSLADQIAAFSAAATARVAVNDEGTRQLVMSGKVDSFRYSTYKARDFDAITLLFAHAYTFSKYRVFPDIDVDTTHTLLVGVEFNAVYGSGFDPWRGSRYSPLVSWQIGSIPLAHAVCVTNKKVFCLSAGAKFTVLDNMLTTAFQDNTAFRFEPSITWVTPVKGLIFTVTGAAMPRKFHGVSDGRQDVIYEIAPSFEYYMNPNTIVAGTLKYARAVSNPGTFDWSGYTASPQLKLTKKF